MIDLVSLFEKLPAPTYSEDASLRFETASIPDFPSYYVGKAVNGDPVLLVDVAVVDTSSLPPMRLQSLTVYHRARCRITIGDHDEERTFAVLWHTNGNAESRTLYLNILAPVIASMGDTPTASRIANVIETLAHLFRSLTQPSRKTTQGLWAELLVVATSTDPVMLTRAWHVHSDDRYDFNAGVQRIEVKSAGIGARRHHFSFEQLRPPAGAEVVVVSMLVSRAASGLSLKILMDRVIERLAKTPELQTRVYEVVTESLGQNFTSGLAESYDEQLGLSTLWFVDHTIIPSIAAPLPPGISEVKFVADLTEVKPMSTAELRMRGALYQALLTRDDFQS